MSDDLDFLAELDAEISKVSEKARLEERRVKLTKDLRNPRLGAARRDDAELELKSVSNQLNAIQWRPTSNVAFFNEQHCRSCNSKHHTFLQHMQRQVTTSGPKVDRLVRIPRPLSGYANEVVMQVSETFVCIDCADAFGFDVTSSTKMIGNTSEVLAVSKTYIQEQPDAPTEED